MERPMPNVPLLSSSDQWTLAFATLRRVVDSFKLPSVDEGVGGSSVTNVWFFGLRPTFRPFLVGLDSIT